MELVKRYEVLKVEITNVASERDSCHKENIDNQILISEKERELQEEKKEVKKEKRKGNKKGFLGFGSGVVTVLLIILLI